MKQNQNFKWAHIWKLSILLSLFSIFSPFINVLVYGQVIDVKVLVEETHWNDCDDTLSPPDIYHKVTIDGVELSSRSNPITVNIAPFNVNREFSQDVDASKRNIPIIIEEWDEDSGLNFDDDQCNIQPGPGKALNLVLDLATCEISGEASGVCGTSIEIQTSDIYFVFSIEVEEPPHTAGLSVRCLHDPIWPQPGDQITITAEALDGTALAKGGVIDDIEIWVDNTNSPAANTASTPGSFGVNTLTLNHNPAASADQLLYRCRVSDDGDEVSSGWRIAQIGNPPLSWIRSVPILQTGPMGSRQDIVFIADDNSYTGPNDPQFLADVHTVIRDAYFSAGIMNRGLPFLLNQNLINFWIALRQGTAVSFGSGSHDTPDEWDERYHFADAGAIVHTNPWPFRDQANRGDRIFSAQNTSLGVFLHETGHTPFGLADEYCCDSHYFQPDPNPNIYEDRGDCLDDALSTGVADACEQIEDPTTGDTIDWFRLDSDSTVGDDLMLNNLTPQPADERRIDWLFDICRNGGC